jgi:hypothetical protein
MRFGELESQEILQPFAQLLVLPARFADKGKSALRNLVNAICQAPVSYCGHLRQCPFYLDALR